MIDDIAAWLRSQVDDDETLAESDYDIMISARKVRDAAAEIARLRAALKWNIERGGDDLLICEGNHERHEDCTMQRWVRAEKVATARRKGMEDAAQIAEGEIYHERYRTWPWWEDRPGYGRGNVSEDSQLVLHCDAIAAAIRAAAKES